MIQFDSFSLSNWVEKNPSPPGPLRLNLVFGKGPPPGVVPGLRRLRPVDFALTKVEVWSFGGVMSMQVAASSRIFGFEAM